jgi:hypothetical protein
LLAVVLFWATITERNRIQSVRFGMQNRTLGPYSIAINGVLIPAMHGQEGLLQGAWWQNRTLGPELTAIHRNLISAMHAHAGLR